MLRLLVGTRFQGLLSPSRGASHLSLTILVHYRSHGVFSLREWSPQIHAGFLGPRITRVQLKAGRLVSVTGLSPSMDHLSREIHLPSGMVTARQVLHPSKNCPTTPTTHRCKAIACNRFRLFPFRSPLLRESHSLSSPPLTEMFQFSGLPLPRLYIQRRVTRHDSRWVAPFGYLRVTACKRLSEAFRCLLRPSSAPSAKASTVRPLQLDYAKFVSPTGVFTPIS